MHLLGNARFVLNNIDALGLRQGYLSCVSNKRASDYKKICATHQKSVLGFTPPNTTMRRRTIKGALPNFLGTYTSRYSDYDGYWIFGILLGSLGELQIDLLGPVQGDPQGPAIAAAIQLARQRFREQIEKAGSSISCTRDASLKIMRLPQPETGAVNGRICAGHRVRFVARVVSDLGKTYESEKCVFVAPHDPKVELRSTRGT